MSSPFQDPLAIALSSLWDIDTNRLIPGQDYTLDAQQRATGNADAANAPLITSINPAVWHRPTFATFKRLLDNYTANTGVPERADPAQRAEEQQFLAAICDTDVIRFAYEWLSSHSPMRCSSLAEFSEMLHVLWFQYYSRDGCRDSCGFEHVFCGEIDDGVVKGLHNFVQVHLEELRGNFNYKGYLNVRGEPCQDPPPPEQQLVTVRFEWLGKMKLVSSMFVGVSPEFEIALYTMMFVAGKDDLLIDLGPYRTRVKVYQMAGKIGTAYPELVGVDVSRLGQSSERNGAIPGVAVAATGGALAGLGLGGVKKLDHKQIKKFAKMAQKHGKGKKRKGKNYGIEVDDEEWEEELEEHEGDTNEHANGQLMDEEGAENHYSQSSHESSHEHTSHTSHTSHTPHTPHTSHTGTVEGNEEAGDAEGYAHETGGGVEEHADGGVEMETGEYAEEEAGGDDGGEGGNMEDEISQLCEQCCTIV